MKLYQAQHWLLQLFTYNSRIFNRFNWIFINNTYNKKIFIKIYLQNLKKKNENKNIIEGD